MFATLLLLLCCCASMGCSYKILVVSPTFGYSHMNFMGSIADTLADAGHEVVTLQPVIFPQAGSGTSRSRLIRVEIDQKMATQLQSSIEEKQELMWTSGATNPMSVLGFLPLLKQIVSTSVSVLLENKKLLEELEAEEFDVGIGELFDFIGITVFEAIGLRNFVGAHSQACLVEGTAYSIGAPVIPSFMPASQGVTDDSTLLQARATNVIFTFLSWYFQTSLASSAETAMFKALGAATPPIWDTVSNMTWVLTNAEPLLEFAKPTLPAVVDIGGIGVGKLKPLDEKWNRTLSLRPRTILISFGSVAPSSFMPAPMKEVIAVVAKSYPNITFIWKYEDPDSAPFADGAQNLILSKWTPQNDLLADPRLTLFITHGGAGSLLESATHGKPVIVVPLFGDQTRNAKIVTKFGFGVHIEKSHMCESSALRGAIGNILNEPGYTQAAHRIRDLLAMRPFTPEQKLVRTVELAAEFGQIPELQVAGRNLNFFVYHNLDLVMLLALTFSLLLFCLRKLFKLALRSATKIKVQ